MDNMYTPVFKNTVHDIEFVFPKLYVPTELYAEEVGKAVRDAAKNDSFVDVIFTGKVANLKELAEDKENLRIIAPFNSKTGEQDYILILTPAGEVPKDLKGEDTDAL